MKKTFTQIFGVIALVLGLQVAQAQDQILTINSPSNIAGSIEELGQPVEDFLGVLNVGESVTGDLALVMSDTTGGLSATTGCTTITNPDEINGKIALIDRGDCFFSDKVYFAQEAGATAVIICNHTPGAGIINMISVGDYMSTDTITSLMINYEDCQEIKNEMANGTVNVTIAVEEFIQCTAATNTQTPQAYVRPVTPSATIFNTTADTVEVEITWAITDPNGVTSNVVGIGSTSNTGAVIIADESYMPEAIGTYNVVATNNINNQSISTQFFVTENLFTNDNGSIEQGWGPNAAAFVETYTQNYDNGMLFRIGEEVPTEVSHVEKFSFGLENWQEINTDATSSVDFTVVIYDAPLDDMGEVADFPAGFTYDDFGTPLSFAIYSSTGEEADGELVDVVFDTPFPVEANKAYYIFVQYNGENTGNGIPPYYLYGGNTFFYPYNSTPLVLNEFFTRWNSSPGFALRTYLGSGTNGTSDVLANDAVKLTPNPASTELNIALDLENVSSEVYIQIVDVTARTVAYEKYNNIRQANLGFDVTDYAAGTYFVQITTEEGTSMQKFVKQ